jgi:hypothetical protein
MTPPRALVIRFRTDDLDALAEAIARVCLELQAQGAVVENIDVYADSEVRIGPAR